MATIMIVDDDAHIRELLSHSFSEAGYGLMEAADGREALRKLESAKVDIAVVDIMMPGLDGWELCRKLKDSFPFPVLMLTAKGETSDKVRGLNLGADDYLSKPFDTAELIARVRALLRRYKIESSQRVEVGALTLDRRAREVGIGEDRLTIPLKEFDLLFKLASYPGKTYSREELIEEVWGIDFDGNERTVDVHVNRLRDRFPEERCRFRIRTLRGLGYRLETLP